MLDEATKPTLTLEMLQQFFEERKPVLNVGPIGEEAGLSQGHFSRVVRGERELTANTITKLLPVLYKYGYKKPQASNFTTLTLEQFQQFLSERKGAINVTYLAEEIGMSRGHLNQIVAGTRGFTQKTVNKLLIVLPKYGYQE